jgi:hypothetical protein
MQAWNLAPRHAMPCHNHRNVDKKVLSNGVSGVDNAVRTVRLGAGNVSCPRWATNSYKTHTPPLNKIQKPRWEEDERSDELDDTSRFFGELVISI